MNEFFTWAGLATYSGCLAMVLVLTQLTKGLSQISRLPTQLWSYILSLLILLTASYFNGNFTLENTVLSLFNAAIVSLSANGGFEVLKKIIGK